MSPAGGGAGGGFWNLFRISYFVLRIFYQVALTELIGNTFFKRLRCYQIILMYSYPLKGYK